ncbi:hypothetical protein EP7_000066 [Isosphaeraceae bacterium EP7]
MYELIDRYSKGTKTSQELVVDCLNLVDPGDPSLVLGELPPETLPQLAEFLENDLADGMRDLDDGAIPTPAQVTSARCWLAMQDRVFSQQLLEFLQARGK